MNIYVYSKGKQRLSIAIKREDHASLKPSNAVSSMKNKVQRTALFADLRLYIPDACINIQLTDKTTSAHVDKALSIRIHKISTGFVYGNKDIYSDLSVKGMTLNHIGMYMKTLNTYKCNVYCNVISYTT